jgi:hypothetical protein
LRRTYVLFFIELDTRRDHLTFTTTSGPTAHAGWGHDETGTVRSWTSDTRRSERGTRGYHPMSGVSSASAYRLALSAPG